MGLRVFYWYHLQSSKPAPKNCYPVYDTKRHQIILEIWELWGTSSLLIIPCSLCPGMVVPFRVRSMDQLYIFKNYSYSIKKKFKKLRNLNLKGPDTVYCHTHISRDVFPMCKCSQPCRLVVRLKKASGICTWRKLEKLSVETETSRWRLIVWTTLGILINLRSGHWQRSQILQNWRVEFCRKSFSYFLLLWTFYLPPVGHMEHIKCSLYSSPALVQ